MKNICKRCDAEVNPAIGNCSLCDGSVLEQTKPTVRIPKPIVEKPRAKKGK